MFIPLLPGEFVMDKDSVNAYIPIELLRSKIDPMVDTVYRIVLDLEVNDEFGLGVKEKLQSKVVFSNYLQEPVGGMLWSSCTGGLSSGKVSENDGILGWTNQL